MFDTRVLFEILGLAVVALYVANLVYLKWRRKQDRKAAEQESDSDLGVMDDLGEDLVVAAQQASAREKLNKDASGRVEDTG